MRQHVIWYDPSEVTTRPNRAEDADKGFTNHIISGDAWRKAHNFTDDDAPTSTEIALRLLLDKGNLTPELAESLLTVIAPEVMQAVRDASQAANPETALTPDVENALGGEEEVAPPAETEPPSQQPENTDQVPTNPSPEDLV